jgi:sulfoxide reductase heme-binding subunit YedZ
VCVLSLLPALDLWRVLNQLNPKWLTAYDYRVFTLGIAASGAWAFIFLFLTLAVSPLQRLTGLRWLPNLRRTLGLFAFFYILLHFAFYMIVGQKLRFDYVWQDAFFQRSRIPGWLALFLLVPLALTSFDVAVRWLGGKRWKRLHWLVFPATALAIVHQAWSESDNGTGYTGARRTGLAFAIVIALRLIKVRRTAAKQT